MASRTQSNSGMLPRVIGRACRKTLTNEQNGWPRPKYLRKWGLLRVIPRFGAARRTVSFWIGVSDVRRDH
jgi:hypothetical protein